MGRHRSEELDAKRPKWGAVVRGLCAAWLIAACATLSPAQAQQGAYPTRPIRLIVSFPPGGGLDVIARVFADKMKGILAQNVIVENRAGAAGAVAGKQVVATEPDGYTILVASNSMIINQIMNPESGLDTEKQLLAVASVAPQAVVIVTAPDIKANSLKDLLELGRSRQLNFGTPGPGSIPHLLFEQFLSTVPDLKMTHVPFQGAAPALTAVIGGQIEVASVTLPPAVALVNSGKVRGIAVTSAARSAALPQLPTTTEAGFPNAAGTAWCAFFVPAKTPKVIADRLSEVFMQIAAMPEVQERLGKLGFEPTNTPGEEFRKQLSLEIKTWTAMVDKIGLRRQ